MVEQPSEPREAEASPEDPARPTTRVVSGRTRASGSIREAPSSAVSRATVTPRQQGGSPAPAEAGVHAKLSQFTRCAPVKNSMRLMRAHGGKRN